MALVVVFRSLVAEVKAAEMWFHSAHHVSKGSSFTSDHGTLYADIYGMVGGQFDAFMERGIGLSGDESLACPKELSTAVSGLLGSFPSPCGQSGDGIASMALQVLRRYLGVITQSYESLKQSGEITLGVDDLLMAEASAVEKYLYMLGQRAKVSQDPIGGLVDSLSIR